MVEWSRRLGVSSLPGRRRALALCEVKAARVYGARRLCRDHGHPYHHDGRDDGHHACPDPFCRVRDRLWGCHHLSSGPCPSAARVSGYADGRSPSPHGKAASRVLDGPTQDHLSSLCERDRHQDREVGSLANRESPSAAIGLAAAAGSLAAHDGRSWPRSRVLWVREEVQRVLLQDSGRQARRRGLWAPEGGPCCRVRRVEDVCDRDVWVESGLARHIASQREGSAMTLWSVDSCRQPIRTGDMERRCGERGVRDESDGLSCKIAMQLRCSEGSTFQ